MGYNRQTFKLCEPIYLSTNSISVDIAIVPLSLSLYKFYPLCVFASEFPANMYLLKVNNRNSKQMWNMFKVINKDTKTTLYC